MRSFSDGNPVAVALYFAAVAGIAMFCMHPVLLMLSLFGAILFAVVQNGTRLKNHLGYLGLFLLLALINPIVSHNGVTVLFVVNNTPITMEAVLYGLAAAGMIVGVLYWFGSFTAIMTSDKLLYLFGKLSPRLALILSMGLRYVPLFRRQSQKIQRAQTAMGLYKEDNIADRIKGGVRVFSVMVTWGLENGIITADSMTARGYGTGKRSQLALFRFCTSDWVLLALTAVLAALTCIPIAAGHMSFVFYPAVTYPPATPLTVMGWCSYGTLALLPTIMEAEERIKWKFLQSRI